MLAGLSLLIALAAPPAPPAPPTASVAQAAGPGRVFFAPLRAEGVDDVTKQSIEGAVLVAARKVGVTVIGAGDVQALLDVEAARQAAGCDSDSCAAELADALGAPELMTGQIAHLGDTWVLTLTRLGRADLNVLGRSQIARDGTSAAVLLPVVDGIVADVLGRTAAAEAPQTSGSPLVVVGGVVAGSGAAVGIVGAALWGASAAQHDAGKRALAGGDVAGAAAIRGTWEPVYLAGIVGVGVGVAAVVVGVGLVAGGLLSGEDS